MSVIAGWNIPGCLPEAEPLEFETVQEAFDYIVSNVDLFWDEDSENPYIDADERWLELHTELHKRGAATAPWSGGCADGHLVFWIEPAGQARPGVHYKGGAE